MPRASEMPAERVFAHPLIIGVEKAGKSDWAMKAALAGFNVLYLGGDVDMQTLKEQPLEAKKRIFHLDFSDDLAFGNHDPRFINLMTDFMGSSKFVWNDSQQKKFNLKNMGENDEVWEIFPARLDWRWVLVIDSWTMLSYSGMISKAIDLGVELADVEKINREIYAGVGNRLTNMLTVIQKMKTHVIVIGHPAEYQKKKMPDRSTQRDVKELDQIIEWTRMIPKSHSNPHGLTMGKFFTDVGWMDVTRGGTRKLSFKLNEDRSSGGHLNSEGDPRGTHSFAELVKAIGGAVPDPERPEDIDSVIVMHGPGQYQPAAKATPVIGNATAASKTVSGLGGLAGLKKPA